VGSREPVWDAVRGDDDGALGRYPGAPLIRTSASTATATTQRSHDRPAMSPFSTALFKGTGADLFSPAQLQRLMRVEFERAQRYRYPIVMLLVAVDRLAQLQDLYGASLKGEVTQALLRLLKTDLRSSDSLAAMVDDRVVVLVPHTEPDGASALAKRLLEGMRAHQFECDGRTTRISVSIGGAHNQKRTELSFETMLEVAEGGLEVASRGGGNRYVHSDLYDFFQKKHERETRAKAAVAVAPAIPVAVPTHDETASLVSSGLLGDKIRELFGAAALDPMFLARIEQEVIGNALREMRGDLERALSDSANQQKRQIETLERRISKLTHALGVTEEELQRVLKLKGVDPGIASIYRSVQGLSSDEVAAELKKELMAKIFQANVDMRRQFSSQTGGAPTS
jgi:diguanylate cyclase (GGDEF)-like protein